MLHELVQNIFRSGVHGSAENLYQWCMMNLRLKTEGVPENLRSYLPAMTHQVNGISLPELMKPSAKEAIKQFTLSLKEREEIELVGPYNEYRLKDHSQWNFHNQDQESFFICNDLTLSPLQFIRSRVQNFCTEKNISDMHRDEIVISVTEATENAIKYSNAFPVYIEHGIKDKEYSVRVVNSVNDVNLTEEISKGKFSEDVSLMRGVLVMSKLLDFLDIVRDTENRRVEFVGRKKVRLKN